jgi:hypothetical protein
MLEAGRRSMSDRNSSSRSRWATARRSYRPVRASIELQLDREIGEDAADLARHERRLPVLGEALAHLALHVVEVLVDRVERPELLEQAAGGLLPHARHAGDVVGGIALERLVVEHLVGAEAVALHDPGLVVDDGGGDPHARRQEADVVVDQLQPIEVAGYDHRVDPLGGRLLRERADDVIGLIALQLADGHAEHLADLAHDRELGAEVVRHARATGLVVREGVEAELRLAEVEADDRVVRLHVLHAPQHDLEKAEDGVDQQAVGHRERRQCKVAAVHEARPVDEHEERSAVGHGSGEV